jgi:hypothetical protein
VITTTAIEPRHLRAKEEKLDRGVDLPIQTKIQQESAKLCDHRPPKHEAIEVLEI